jgi:hypothetical protein
VKWRPHFSEFGGQVNPVCRARTMAASAATKAKCGPLFPLASAWIAIIDQSASPNLQGDVRNPVAGLKRPRAQII